MKTEKILIVDDLKENLFVLKEALKSRYKVVTALSGEKALAIAGGENPPSLILLDIMMPDMDGYEVCKRLKASPRTWNIPIIFVTAVKEPVDEARAFSLGAVDYITKPFNPIIVQVRVENHLRLRRKSELLEQLAMIDGLTEIHNRRFFDDALANEWFRAKRGGRALSLLLLDIDLFKLVNDHYGHAVGDDCLRKVARTLADSLCRASDQLCRFGGEEFAVILPETETEGALETAERLRSRVVALNYPHAYSHVADCVTVSIGVATLFPEGSNSKEDLIAIADASLYKAKAEGRNRVIASLPGKGQAGTYLRTPERMHSDCRRIRFKKFTPRRVQMPFINIKLLEGALTDEEKEEVIRRVSEVVAEVRARPLPMEKVLPHTTCIIEEVPLSQWGIGGKVIPKSALSKKTE